jgi:hypothetical protein
MFNSRYDVIVKHNPKWSEVRGKTIQVIQFLKTDVDLEESKSFMSFYNMGSDRYVSEIAKHGENHND